MKELQNKSFLRVFGLVLVLFFALPIIGFAEKVVVIDPGHGGKHTGSCGITKEPNKDICERDVNLQVSLKLRDTLKSLGFTVYMTRDTDMHFSEYLKNPDGSSEGGDFDIRMKTANSFVKGNNDNTVFISVHHNGSPTSTHVKGYETYYYDGINHYKPEWPADPLAIKYTPENKRLAEAIHPLVVSDVPMIDRKIHNDQSFYVIRNAQMPGVLLELGYMTNREEETLIKDPNRQKRAANAVANGIVKYFKVFEVFKDTNKLATFNTKDEAISYANKQTGTIKIFDKFLQKYVWDNSNYQVYHKTNGLIKAFATEQEAINYAQATQDTRVVDRATKWTIWSNFITNKYVLKDQNNSVIGNYYDLNQATNVAKSQSNTKIVHAVSNEVIWTNISGVVVTRTIDNKKVFGMDRYTTSTAISQELYPNGFASEKASKTVILATGKAFADALSTGPLSVKYDNAPILLTETATLNSKVKEELIRLKAENVIIIGGTAAVDSSVELELEAMGITPKRIAGVDRYDTNQKIMAEIGDSVTGVFVASATSFPDALAAAPIAAANNWGIILTNKDSITPEALATMNGKKIVILGGTAVISDQVENKILSENNASNVVRIGGEDRYETMAGLLWYFKDQIKSDTVYVTTGTNFPDALAAAPMSISTKAPLILVGTSVKPNVQSFLMGYSEENLIRSVRVFGGVVEDGATESIITTLK
jgi:N-acetylmuramoyl-L-alanine amidase